jgi:hypothetical protein
MKVLNKRLLDRTLLLMDIMVIRVTSIFRGILQDYIHVV